MLSLYLIQRVVQFVYLLVVVFCLESTAAGLAYFHSTKVGRCISVVVLLANKENMYIYVLCVFFLLHQLHSEISPLSSVFQNYSGSRKDRGSQAVDATQKKVCFHVMVEKV